MFEDAYEDFLREIVKEERLDEETIKSLLGLITKFGMPIVRRIGTISSENRKELYLMNLSEKLSGYPEWQELFRKFQKEDKHNG